MREKIKRWKEVERRERGKRGERKGGKRWVGKWGARGSKAVREVKIYTSLNLLPSSCCPMHIPHTIPHMYLLTYTSLTYTSLCHHSPKDSFTGR